MATRPEDLGHRCDCDDCADCLVTLVSAASQSAAHPTPTAADIDPDEYPALDGCTVTAYSDGRTVWRYADGTAFRYGDRHKRADANATPDDSAAEAIANAYAAGDARGTGGRHYPRHRAIVVRGQVVP